MLRMINCPFDESNDDTGFGRSGVFVFIHMIQDELKNRNLDILAS